MRTYLCVTIHMCMHLDWLEHTVHRTEKDRTGQDRTEKDRTGQDRTEKDRTRQDRTEKDRTGQDKIVQYSTQDRKG